MCDTRAALGSRIVALGVVAVLGLGIGAAACRQVAGIKDSPPEALSSAECGLEYGTPTCAACASSHCCAQSSACAGDPTCETYEDCLGGCQGDPACRERCNIDHPARTDEVTALSVCLASHCENECGLTCGAFAGYNFEPDAAAACQACYAANACSAGRDCATLTACDGINRCVFGVSTIDALNACFLSHGADPGIAFEPGDAASNPWITFTAVHNGMCGTACAIGSYWECVGTVSWPVVKYGTTATTAHFWEKDFSQSPVSDGEVLLCTSTDPDCASPLAMGTTSATGEVSLPFGNAGNISGEQNLGLDGFFRMVASPSHVSTDIYWGFPLSQPDFFFSGTVVDTSILQAQAQASGVQIDPSLGTLAVIVYDCNFGVASGVQASLDPMNTMTRSFDTAGVATSITGTSGEIIFENVPPGFVQVTATPTGLGRPSGKATVTVHANALTELTLLPTPMP